MTDSPYIKLHGLAFQTGGSANETNLNRDASMRVLKRYVLGKGSSQDVEVALRFLENTFPREASEACAAIRATFPLDWFLEREYIDAICIPAFNTIWNRLGYGERAKAAKASSKPA